MCSLSEPQTPPSMNTSPTAPKQSPCLPKSPLLLLLCRFRRVRLRATPEMAAHQAPQSLGFSRQEHWSGLPFPSPTQVPSGRYQGTALRISACQEGHHSVSLPLWGEILSLALIVLTLSPVMVKMTPLCRSGALSC